MLLEHGANVNARNKSNKRTALHEAVNPPPHLGNYNYSFLDVLLKHHPDVNAKDISGYTPFHYLVYDIPFIPLSESSKSKILRAMKALISAGAYLSEKNNYGNSCIEVLKHFPSSIRAQFLSDLAAWMQEEKKQKPSFTAFMNRALNGKLIWSFTDKHKTVHTTPPPVLPLEIIYKVFNHMHYSWNLTDHIIDHKEEEEEENILNNYLEFMQAIEEEQIAFESFADFRALLEQ